MVRKISYPNVLNDIALVGYESEHIRNIILRPLLGGSYIFLVWPVYFFELERVYFESVYFNSVNFKPQKIRIDRSKLNSKFINEWDWKLVRTPDGWSSKIDKQRDILSSLIFDKEPIVRGKFKYRSKFANDPIRSIIWSCHQPYNNSDIANHTNNVLTWFEETTKKFDPDIIFGAGDTAYCDGTAPTDLTNGIYDNPTWRDIPNSETALDEAYRKMYLAHWSFPQMQEVMRNFAHSMMWDDHEIHDGYGSEVKDFKPENKALYLSARRIAEEYLLNTGPRVRQNGDAHQAWITGIQANFVFDARSSRNYPKGKVISQRQLNDFTRFCELIKSRPRVKLLITQTGTPFVHVREVVNNIMTRLPDLINKPTGFSRDDLRDGWSSPGNSPTLINLLAIYRNLMLQRPDLKVVNISGDIHVANAFKINLHSTSGIIQINTSALTNRPNDNLRGILGKMAEIQGFEDIDILNTPLLAASAQTLGALSGITAILTEGDLLSGLKTIYSTNFQESLFTLIRDNLKASRIWPTILNPNILCVTTTESEVRFDLKTFQLNEEDGGDQSLILPL